MKWHRQIEPKPFAYVDILKEKPAKQRYMGHETFKENLLTAQMTFVIKVLSEYLFVGSGLYDYKGNTVYYAHFRTNGEIAIPGTGIKGSVRSIVEAISNSCVLHIARNEKRVRPSTHKPCEFKEDKTENLGLCPACRIFGTTGYSGRVRFSDGKTIKLIGPEIVKIGELFAPTNVEKKRKFYQNKKFLPIGDSKPEKNTRFVEAIKKDSTFAVNLSFDNLSKSELSLLLHAMGIGQEFLIKVGGAKPRCFGSVKFMPQKMKVSNNIYDDFDEKGGKTLESYLQEILSNKQLIKENLLDQFVQATMESSDEPCPRRLY